MSLVLQPGHGPHGCASSDQTTRIHAAVPCASGTIWHEVARPQVHGYDLIGAVWLSPWTFASIADEKIVRVFEAPGGFVETVKTLGVHGVVENNVCGIQSHE